MNLLLKLARKSIEDYFQGVIPEVTPEVKKQFSELKSCFVCITKNGKLRGISGNLKSNKELYREVIENSVDAAFHDKTSSPLKKEELSAIKIEISILTSSEQLDFESTDDLLNKINVGSDGIMIQKGYHSANFLPQVWEEIFDKDEFLSLLCEKAGLPDDEWKKPGMQIWTYRVERVRE